MSNGSIVLLIDESPGMATAIVDGKKSKADTAATAVNSLLRQLASGPEIDVCLVGYGPGVGVRWQGALAGREFVPTSELAAATLAVEQRTRRVPDPSGFGPPREETVEFPVWYRPEVGGEASQSAAFAEIRRLLEGRLSDAEPPPVVLHVTASRSSDGDPRPAIEQIRGLAFQAPPLVFQAHLGSQSAGPATVCPSNRVYLTAAHLKELFEQTSPLPPAFLEALRAGGATVQTGARGLVFNARLGDLVQLLGLAKTYAFNPFAALEAAPKPARTQNPTDRKPVSHILVAPPPPPGRAAPGQPATPPPVPIQPGAGPAFDDELETSEALEPQPVEGAAGDDDWLPPLDAWGESDEAGDAGDEFALAVSDLDTAEFESDEVEPLEPDEPPPLANDEETPADRTEAAAAATAVVLVLDRSVSDPGAAADEPRESFENACTRLCEHANDLLETLRKSAAGSVDVGLVTYGENGPQTGFGGGLVRDTDLASAAVRVDEVETQIPNGLGGLVTTRRKKHVFVEAEPSGPGNPADAFAEAARLLDGWRAGGGREAVVLHLTRGGQSGAAAAIAERFGGSPEVAVYHLVATESPCPSVSYPGSAETLPPELAELWEVTSPLRGRARLSQERKYIDENSRGFVVNGKFDVFEAALTEAGA